MIYNINNKNKLSVGDKLADPSGNKYVVIEMGYGNTHSQYASQVRVECVAGPHKGRTMWVDHHLASEYKA